MSDWDEETRRLIFSYCGGDPREPGQREVQVFYADGEEWTLAEFQQAIQAAVEKIPVEYRETAVVELSAPDDYGGGSLSITYTRPDNAEEIAERVRRAEAYAREKLEKERAEYDRLRRKYEGGR